MDWDAMLQPPPRPEPNDNIGEAANARITRNGRVVPGSGAPKRRGAKSAKANPLNLRPCAICRHGRISGTLCRAVRGHFDPDVDTPGTPWIKPPTFDLRFKRCMLCRCAVSALGEDAAKSRCSDCNRQAHDACIRLLGQPKWPTMSAGKVCPRCFNPWHVCRFCRACQKVLPPPHEKAQTVACQVCDDTYHLFHLPTPLAASPTDGPWTCDSCSNNGPDEELYSRAVEADRDGGCKSGMSSKGGGRKASAKKPAAKKRVVPGRGGKRRAVQVATSTTDDKSDSDAAFSDERGAAAASFSSGGGGFGRNAAAGASSRAGSERRSHGGSGGVFGDDDDGDEPAVSWRVRRAANIAARLPFMRPPWCSGDEFSSSSDSGNEPDVGAGHSAGAVAAAAVPPPPVPPESLPDDGMDSNGEDDNPAEDLLSARAVFAAMHARNLARAFWEEGKEGGRGSDPDPSRFWLAARTARMLDAALAAELAEIQNCLAVGPSAEATGRALDGWRRGAVVRRRIVGVIRDKERRELQLQCFARHEAALAAALAAAHGAAEARLRRLAAWARSRTRAARAVAAALKPAEDTSLELRHGARARVHGPGAGDSADGPEEVAVAAVAAPALAAVLPLLGGTEFSRRSGGGGDRGDIGASSGDDDGCGGGDGDGDDGRTRAAALRIVYAVDAVASGRHRSACCIVPNGTDFRSALRCLMLAVLRATGDAAVSPEGSDVGAAAKSGDAGNGAAAAVAVLLIVGHEPDDVAAAVALEVFFARRYPTDVHIATLALAPGGSGTIAAAAADDAWGGHDATPPGPLALRRTAVAVTADGGVETAAAAVADFAAASREHMSAARLVPDIVFVFVSAGAADSGGGGGSGGGSGAELARAAAAAAAITAAVSCSGKLVIVLPAVATAAATDRVPIVRALGPNAERAAATMSSVSGSDDGIAALQRWAVPSLAELVSSGDGDGSDGGGGGDIRNGGNR